MAKYNQLIFIDDSGDPGFKFNKGSSDYLVIACVIFDTPVRAEYTAASIKILKENMGWKQEREFKFHRANDVQKISFFNTMKSHSFKIHAVITDKKNLHNRNNHSSESFYGYMVKAALDGYIEMDLARICLDGSGNKNFKRKSTANIRQAINKNSRRMAEFRLVDSRDNVLIQLADMIAGAINAKFDTSKKYKEDYISMLHNQIESIQLISDLQ